MSSAALPPPSNLPSWSRISALDRSRYPRRFVRDRMPQPPPARSRNNGETNVANISNVDVEFVEKMRTAAQNQKANYDKSLKFVQQQHNYALSKLHEELDILKKENKELQFKLIFRDNSDLQSINTDAEKQNTPKQNDENIKLLQKEISDLKKSLKESKAVNDKMEEKVSLISQTGQVVSPLHSSTDYLNEMHKRIYSVTNLSTPLPFNAILNPLQIKDSINDPPRTPTIFECESIINKLHEINCQQLVELSQLRSNRRMSSLATLSPDPFVPKTHGPSTKESFSDTRLPRIPVRPPMKKSIKSASLSDVKVVLPDLKNSMTVNVAGRHRRLYTVRNNKANSLN